MPTLDEAKSQIDAVIRKSRVDLYKPIQIAEVLHRARTVGDLRTDVLETYKNASLGWRNEVTRRLLGKVSTSSAQFQHNVWADNAMPPAMLAVLDAENKRTAGAVERYIYLRFQERQATVASVLDAVEKATATTFQVSALLGLFVTQPGIKRSVDKAYEIVTYSLFETIVTSLGARVKVFVPETSRGLLAEFSDLAAMLLGVTADQLDHEEDAHIYRVGVTNAADRGLDMWANFGPVVQVKHLSLSEDLAGSIVDQVESDHIVLVCTDADAKVLAAVMKQISWGQRVRGIITEQMLVAWYEKCLRGKYADQLAEPLLERLVSSFRAEFPQAAGIKDFLEERSYLSSTDYNLWRTEVDDVEETLIGG